VISRRLLSAPRWVAALLVAGPALLGVGAGWAVEHARGERFEASTDVLVRFWSVESFLLTGQSSPVNSADVADAATLAASRDVLDLAADRLADGRDGAELSGAVTVVPQATSNAVTITATAGDADTARTTSSAVAAAMIRALQNRIAASTAGLTGTENGEFGVLLGQRSQVLTRSVQPLIALETSEPQQTAPTSTALVAFGIVGLAAGTLLLIGVRFARPTVEEPRMAQRIVERPAVAFGQQAGSPDAARLMRRLLDDRPRGSILVVPVDAEAEKVAQQFADWTRERSRDADEAVRIVAVTDPAGAVLAPRPGPGAVAAVLLVVPRGTTRRALADAVSLLAPWQAADAVVVAT
jgi:hypothetical protein